MATVVEHLLAIGHSDPLTGYHPTRLSRLLASPIASYAIPMCLWIIAWQLQAVTSAFVTSPLGLDVIYFTLGARAFSIMIFGFRGVIGLILGSLITNCFVGSAQYPDPLWFLTSYALANTLTVYALIEIVEHYFCDSPDDYGFSMRQMLGIMFVSGIVVSTIHEIFFRLIRPTPVPYDFSPDSFLIQIASRVVGGMLFIMFAILAGKLLFSKIDLENSERI